MKTTQFTEAQIVSNLKLHKNGLKVTEIARANGISEKTFYRWRAKYGGLEINDFKSLKKLEAENCKLKRMYTDLALLKDLIEKKL